MAQPVQFTDSYLVAQRANERFGKTAIISSVAFLVIFVSILALLGHQQQLHLAPFGLLMGGVMLSTLCIGYGLYLHIPRTPTAQDIIST